MGVRGAALDRLRARLLGHDAPPAPGRMLDLPSAQVHVQVRGEGPTVVYMPDPPNGLDSVEGLLEALARRHRVVAFELPGFGWSRAKPGFGFSMWDHAVVLHEVLQATETERARLVAPCLTGFVALAYARAHPERVAALVLPQVPDWPAAQDWADRVDRKRHLRRPWFSQGVTVVAQDVLATGWYAAAEPDAARRQHLVETFRGRPRSGRLFSIASALLALDDTDPLGDHAPLDVPALLLWGEADRSHGRGHAHTLARHLRDPDCETVAAGHFPDLAAPERIVRWLDSLSADDTSRRPSETPEP